MSIISAILRSIDDLNLPSTKSYAKCELCFELVSIESLKNKKELTGAEKRLFRYEIADARKTKYLILLKNTDGSGAGISIRQLKDFLDDIGFNCDIFFGNRFFCDTNLIMNIGGYSLPFYAIIEKFLSHIFPRFKRLLKRKIAAGRYRLHANIFGNGDGTWYVVTHMDFMGFINANPLDIISLLAYHFGDANSDYVFGGEAMKKILEKAIECIKKDILFPIDAVEGIIGFEDYKNRNGL